ncbi:hypothetical protein MCUN1_002526 [Malassezia cuniculi]|uniref:Protein KES1 n=1 Tax=Malassezia cuniculi TaxID=948313 RepID=A0AAF0ES35_9BASI|nr:hypothetical protein MCUN1_002526 [Malassezia cuniculi]
MSAANSSVPADQHGGWMSFLKAIASFSGDLSKLTAPSFILSPVSLTDWGEHPEHFASIQAAATPEQRMVVVLRWFIATLKGQYTSRNTSMGSEKKPLNPVLGELFYGSWPATDKRGETKLIVEQVSHHPPITAYHLENKDAGVSVEGHSGQKTSFTGRSITVVQVGHAILRIKRDEGDEVYLISLPKLSIDGLLLGSPYIELTGSTSITASTGLTATINYSGRGYFSGKAHSFNASITSNKSKESLLDVSGTWSGSSVVKAGSLLPLNSVFWDADAIPREELSVKPIEEQGEYESRRVWRNVAEGIRKGDYGAASKDKSRIENEQRQLRKDEAAAGTKHQLKHFEYVESDSDYASLAPAISGLAPTSASYRFKSAAA